MPRSKDSFWPTHVSRHLIPATWPASLSCSIGYWVSISCDSQVKKLPLIWKNGIGHRHRTLTHDYRVACSDMKLPARQSAAIVAFGKNTSTAVFFFWLQPLVFCDVSNFCEAPRKRSFRETLMSRGGSELLFPCRFLVTWWMLQTHFPPQYTTTAQPFNIAQRSLANRMRAFYWHWVVSLAAYLTSVRKRQKSAVRTAAINIIIIIISSPLTHYEHLRVQYELKTTRNQFFYEEVKWQ